MWLFALTIFVGAFLLFQVQPIIARYILPWFGGAPGVWTACMVFFQVLLMGGYGYAHFSIKKLSPRWQAATHLVLLGACVALLHVVPEASWKPQTAAEIANPTWRIVALLAVHVGLPFFVLSSTSPLLQAWVSRRNGGRAPYKLYALSNLGSLLALLSYPFIFEPLFGRTVQAEAWSWGMRLFVMMCACCTLWAWRARGAAEAAPVAKAEELESERISLVRWMLWFLLPASASVLLLGTTNKLCEDIAVTPFLWVLPLAMYLLSFILTFESPRSYWRRFYMVALFIGMAFAVHAAFRMDNRNSLVGQVVLYTGILFVACMIFHGELARLRPTSRHLTAFYLMIAAGGATGGVFVAVVAPLVFSSYHELDIGMFLCSTLLLVAVYLDDSSFLWGGVRGRLVWVGMVGLPVAMGLALLCYPFRPTSQDLMARYRSFYGVLSVYDMWDNGETHYRILQNGHITHGLQFYDRERSLEPTSYYERPSGVGLAISELCDAGPRHIGVVGLGTGTLAAFARDGDRIRFYEINPQVEQIARSHFTYLGDCRGKVDVILGDARLSLEREAAQEFDVLALDAFSSDAIPVHLLTREAFEIYLRHLKPRGVIAVHTSNRFLDLEPIVMRIVKCFGLHGATVLSYRGTFHPQWVLLMRDATILEKLKSNYSRIQLPRSGDSAPLWTDDHASLLPALRGGGFSN